MYPDHNGKLRMHSKPSRTCYIQVEAFVFVMLECLVGNIRLVNTKKNFLGSLAILGLGTDGTGEIVE